MGLQRSQTQWARTIERAKLTPMSETIPQETTAPLYVAIGDVHGQARLLEDLYAVVADEARAWGAREKIIVHLGDYIDRGPDSQGVIDLVKRGIPGFRTVALRGNHEQMMLDAIVTRNPTAIRNWVYNGGATVLTSFGCAGHTYEAAIDDFAARHADILEWLDALPFFMHAPPYYFVHAGIVPGRPLDRQIEKDLIWIRGTFLDDRRDHGALIVHGHTPNGDEPEILPNRLNLDTGAAYGGPLTAAVLDGAEPRWPQIFQVFPRH
jgi:serine/threonine protein phosphatase 1